MTGAALAGLMAAAPAAHAQLFTEVTETHLPAGLAGQCMDAAVGDVDGDGDPDLALAMEFEPNILLLNDGEGRFTDASDALPRTVHDSEDVALADFDGDGDLDMVLVSEDDRTDELYLNDGTSGFEDASARLPTDAVSNALALIDLNGDGAPDILTGNIGTDRVLLNGGDGSFTDATDDLWPQDPDDPSRTQDLEVADIDGDGAPDVVVANEGGNRLYLNRDGVLTEASESRLPPLDDETREIRAADMDGDGDLDLLVGNVAFLMPSAARDRLLINDGSGVFSEADSPWPADDGRGNFTIQAADLDGDGDLDVLSPATLFPGGPSAPEPVGDLLVLLNDGLGRFETPEAGAVFAAPVMGNGFDVEVADLNADGAADLFFCNRASVRGAPDTSGGLQRLFLAAPGG